MGGEVKSGEVFTAVQEGCGEGSDGQQMGLVNKRVKSGVVGVTR